MKITKQRILQIIKEEVEAAQQDDTNTKQKLRKDFLAVANKFLPDADMVSAEVELTSALMNKILKKAGEAGTSATQLKRLNDIAGKLLAEEKDTLEEMGAPASNPSLTSAKAGIRQDLNKVKKDPENKLKAFLTKYADLKIENGELKEITPKTPYAGYNKLSQEDQKKYADAVLSTIYNVLDNYGSEIAKIYNQPDTATADPNPEEQKSPPPSDAVDAKQSPAETESIYKQIKDMIINNLPDAKGNPEEIIDQAQIFYSDLFDYFYPKGYQGRQEKIPLLNSANNAISQYVKSKGTALNEKGKSVLMDVSNLGDPEEWETIRNVLLKGLNLALGLEEDASPWENESEPSNEPETGTKAEPSTQPEINTEILKDLVIKFANMLKDNNLLAEAIGDIVKLFNITDTKKFGDLLEKTFTREEIKMIDGIFQSHLKDTFINLVKQAATKKTKPADEPAVEEPKPDEKGVVELPSGDKAIPSQFNELVDEFKRFSDDDDGFMMKAYLKDQDVLLKDLRSALRKFIGLENLEAALKEVEEPTPEPKSKPTTEPKSEPTPEPKPEDKTKGSRESLVKHVSRYRRDINDVSKVLAQYLQQAKAGTYKAQPILNKLKVELQNLQDDNALIIRDLKALAGLKESLLLEEESREEKIANVRRAYDEIVNLLRPLLNVETVASPTPQQSGEEEASDEQQNEELIIEDIYLEAAVTPTKEELQSYVTAVKDALTAIDSIKGYFRLTGTFNRPLEEVKNDFVEYIQDYKKTMSDLVSDLKAGVPDANKAQQYADSFARLAKQIQEDFGISPKELIKTPEVTVAPADADDKTAAINPSSEAEQAADADDTTLTISDESPLDQGGRDALDQADAAMKSQVTDFEIEDDDEDQSEPEAEIQKDVETFVKKSNKFLKDIIFPFFKAINADNKTDILKVKKTLADLMKQKLVETKENEENMADLVDQVESAKDLLTDIIIFLDTDEILKIKDSVLKPLFRDYNEIHKKLVTVYNKPLQTFIDKLGDLDKEIQQDIESMKPKVKQIIKFQTLDDTPDSEPFKQGMILFVSSDDIPDDVDKGISKARLKQINNIYDEFKKENPEQQVKFKAGGVPRVELEESKNLLERLIKQELKVLNGKKMVRY